MKSKRPRTPPARFGLGLFVWSAEFGGVDWWPAVVQVGGLCPGSLSASEGNDLMADESPYIDYENLPIPSEGILATLFITVRKVAQSRDFYSRVLGGKVVLEENPCMVKLANSWIIMNPGGGPTPDKPSISVVDYEPDDTTSIFLNLRVADIEACYTEWSERGQNLSRLRSIEARRSAATCAIRMAT